MFELFTNPAYQHGLVAAIALGAACALLSVLVVLRRWAFIGEGISHAGFGGVGTAWAASLAIPLLGSQTAAYGVAVVFCLAMAAAIGWVSWRQFINADAAIGIIMVASLAWGFIALSIYDSAGRPHGNPSGWDFYLLGDIYNLSRESMLIGLCISGAVILTLAALRKEILFYCLDPELAEVSGVRTGFIHYLLMLLVALVIIIGMRLTGYLLVTALLVLPGAVALLLSRRLGAVIVAALVVSLVGVVGGLALRAANPALRSGPPIVLVLFVQFVVAFAWNALARRRA